MRGLVLTTFFGYSEQKQAHNDMIRVYEAKLTEFSIPVEELGFKPLMISTGSRVPNVGAAGLVAAQ